MNKTASTPTLKLNPKRIAGLTIANKVRWGVLMWLCVLCFIQWRVGCTLADGRGKSHRRTRYKHRAPQSNHHFTIQLERNKTGEW